MRFSTHIDREELVILVIRVGLVMRLKIIDSDVNIITVFFIFCFIVNYM